MSLMADPMIALRKFQEALSNGIPIGPCLLDGDYSMRTDDFPDGGIRYCYFKSINGEIQAVSIFGLDEPIDGVECYSVGYAVNEKFRGRGLAVEAVNKGIDDLSRRFGLTKKKRFYVEAVIDVANGPSIKVAEKLFPSPGKAIIETYSGKRALQFKRLIELR